MAGLVIGLIAGGLSFVPYLGFVVGLLSSVGMAAYQFWPEWSRIAIVLAIFFVGQWGSDYFLTPRLVGERAHVHPLWILFSIFAGGAVFGFVGVLLAVPACAAIGHADAPGAWRLRRGAPFPPASAAHPTHSLVQRGMSLEAGATFQ